MTVDTVAWIASMTKVLTATVVMQLWLELDSPARNGWSISGPCAWLRIDGSRSAHAAD
jgi:CubicO group peptidase (beta-lactamase class C family)